MRNNILCNNSNCETKTKAEDARGVVSGKKYCRLTYGDSGSLTVSYRTELKKIFTVLGPPLSLSGEHEESYDCKRECQHHQLIRSSRKAKSRKLIDRRLILSFPG